MIITLHELNMCCPIVAAMDMSLKKNQESRNAYSQELGNTWDEITISYSAVKYV